MFSLSSFVCTLILSMKGTAEKPLPWTLLTSPSYTDLSQILDVGDEISFFQNNWEYNFCCGAE